jgi:Sec-independent protein translocase protein TatA
MGFCTQPVLDCVITTNIDGAELQMKLLARRIEVISALILVLGTTILLVSMKKLPCRASTMSDVLRRMQQYQKDGDYDDAISVGKAWVAKYPQDGSNDQVFGRIASLYLEKAKTDDRNRDEYVAHAIEYRDKMLPVATDATLGWYSMAALQDSASISEHAGDLSERQRCVQYRNARKLLERLRNLLHEKQIQLSKLTDSKQDAFGYASDDVQRCLKETDLKMSQLTEKQQAASCQQSAP